MKPPAKAAVSMMKKAVERVLPKGKGFTLLLDPTSIGGSYVLRVITPAWKQQHRMDRILKVSDELLPVISSSEKRRIFRVSVMTPDEWREFLATDSRSRKITVLAKSGRSTAPASKVGSAVRASGNKTASAS